MSDAAITALVAVGSILLAVIMSWNEKPYREARNEGESWDMEI